MRKFGLANNPDITYWTPLDEDSRDIAVAFSEKDDTDADADSDSDTDGQ
ncbi:hypothetical protein [Staphylococcus gallinarum]|nr:hypothetical protein [Staphylococcus gallinarum]MCD8871686.1 hypothetical protein [Staphylococcus gallinarum]MCW0986075.1 hypothetical protein [Staphylococcus gallinarum]